MCFIKENDVYETDLNQESELFIVNSKNIVKNYLVS